MCTWPYVHTLFEEERQKTKTLAVIDNYNFNVTLSATDTAQLFQTTATAHTIDLVI